MYYCWIKSKRRIIISYIQGVYTSKQYILSVPVCQSITNEFDSFDLGAIGLYYVIEIMIIVKIGFLFLHN